MAQLEITLPEITANDFKRSWTRFELIAKAKEWDEPKQIAIIPALLRGKLLDAYIDIPDENKATLGALKQSLAERAGIAKDPLSAAKLFAVRDQQQQEKVADYVVELRKLFTEAYPTEDVTSTVFLQRFLSGLSPPIGKQVLLKGRPRSMDDAIKMAKEVEFALQFGERPDEPRDICTVNTKPLGAPMDREVIARLQESVEALTKRLDTWETERRTTDNRRQEPRQRQDIRCYLCRKLGHYRNECPLNDQQPGSTRGGTWPVAYLREGLGGQGPPWLFYLTTWFT